LSYDTYRTINLLIMKYKPTDAELEIMQVLWEKGPSTVRSVHEELTKNRAVVYTTTLKVMQNMTEKGLLGRSTDSVSHIYECKISKPDVQNELLDSFVNKVFKGSATSLLMQALGKSKPSASELEKIKKMIEELEKGSEKPD
jgi:BlaI family transcriptional regulator, penicillinase repressor